jgi:hypothetical protein
MSLETIKKVYDALTFEPQTPNEIADKIELNQKTVQGVLLELINTKKNIRWKKIGRRILDGRRLEGTGYFGR